MSCLKVIRLGHPVLRRPARQVPAEAIGGAAIQRLVDDLIETMVEEDGIGLAAPQVGQSLRLLVLGQPAAGAGPDAEAIPLRVLVNPRLVACSTDREWAWEGCLSLPDLRGLVPRASRVVVEAADRHGQPQRLEAAGFLARVLQHEMDHLEGIVYLDRMPDLRQLAFLDEYGRYCQTQAPDAPAAAAQDDARGAQR